MATHITPKTGLQGLAENWRNDLLAAFSVSLVALPLSLGIAMAADLPPMSGVISVVIGSLVTTFFRSSHVAINGPGAGLIAVALAALIGLDDGTGRALHYTLAAFVVAGGIQVLLGFLRIGKYAEMFPSSVIQGILAAIGIIIFGKQIHIALGCQTEATSTIGILMDVPNSLMNLNPVVTLISVLSILLLGFHSKISYKLFHFLPAPMWVLVLSIPFVFLFNFFEPHSINVFGSAYEIGPTYLISLPDNILDSIIFPDFSRITDGIFWVSVISITIIASIETLASAKAVDKLDPYKRTTFLNKELMAVGLGTIVSGMIGGFPVMTVIVRSSVNINNNAKTRWSNFYQGIFILIFILLLSPFIQMVPLASLAAILVFTGYKLASPNVFKHAYEQGMEQLLFITGTLVITLFSNLLWGIMGGILLTLLVHILLARLPIPTFFQLAYKSGTKLIERKDGSWEFSIKGIANFLSILQLKKLIEVIPAKAMVKANLNNTRLIDLTVLEFLQDAAQKHIEKGGNFEINGLDYHIASSEHPLALKSKNTTTAYRLTPRQKKLARLALEHQWSFKHQVEWNTSYLRNFQFFETRPIEHKTNSIKGSYPDAEIHWEIADITFDEGALEATEVYHTTVQIIHLPFGIPKFVLEKEGFFDKLFDRVMAFSGKKDIDFKLFPDFSKKFLLKAEDEAVIRQFFNKELILFFESEEIYHVESNGEALLIFKYLRLAQTEETTKMLAFSEALIKQLKHAHKM